MKKQFSFICLKISIILIFFSLGSIPVFGQGVTSSQMTGQIKDANGEAVIGAVVKVQHIPSGTLYGTITNSEGRYNLQGLRVGGPYKVTASMMGMSDAVRENIFTSLGTAAVVNMDMKDAEIALDEVVISESKTGIFSSSRTGASSNFNNATISTVPTLGSRSITSVTKYNPHGNGSSFGAQDSRLNNFTIDGSVFNNGFGLGSDAQAGGRTGSTAISLDAIEQLQVNVAPFDVRQSGFVGSGINAVTKSGTNNLHGTAFYSFRDPTTTGTRASDKIITVPDFDEKIYGASLGGAIIKNKLFFFANAEFQKRSEPATTFVAKGSSNTGNETRVLKTDLDSLSAFLKSKYGYETGTYEAYNNDTKSDKFMVRLDYNINENNKAVLRYTHHDSKSDQLISNSASAGAGNRRTSIDAMSYENSGYIIGDNTRSIVAELNSNINNKFYNNFIAGYDFQDEDRQYKGGLFPTVDILKDGRTYISAGFDPFTPDNKLDYRTIHLTNNLSFAKGRNNFVVGAHYENYQSNNLFFPASNGVYIFNSLNDFYTAANATTDTSPVTINRFQYRYSALPGFEAPLQVLKVNRVDLYGQDDIQLTNNFRLSAGIRASLISFGETALTNDTINKMNFIDSEGNRGYNVNTGNLPKANILWEPRLGFNWNVNGKNRTQVRGGTGIFTGRPPYVWVSNQVGNNGILTGFIDVTNSRKFRFSDDPTVFRPATPTLPSTFDIASTDEDYRFPQVWKSNIAVDHKIGFGLIGTIELMYNQNINAVLYHDANLEPAASDTNRFKGPDNRLRYPGSYVPSNQVGSATRINDNVSRAAIMTTTNKGFYQAAVIKLEYPAQKGFSGMVAYTRSIAKDLMSASSIASGSYTALRTVNGNNSPTLQFSDNDIPHRVIALVGYRKEYGTFLGGATQFTLGYSGSSPTTQNFTLGRYSLTYGGDMNGDNIRDNDLLFIPNAGSDITFRKLDIKNSAGVVTKTFTPEEQAAAYDKYISNNSQLNEFRGKYLDRNGLILPFVHNFDFSVLQEYNFKVRGNKHAIQFRIDLLNVGNLLNRNWGGAKVLVTDKPVTFAGVNANGTPEFTLATQTKNGTLQLIEDTYIKRASLFDTFSGQFTVRYIF
ncbi:MAG: TonB-dependent receptor [Saprospiraceae bacterium]|nr:TonB-dependent receptor [Saprospiraceae bacterium]